jgi:hypothetical protein
MRPLAGAEAGLRRMGTAVRVPCLRCWESDLASLFVCLCGCLVCWPGGGAGGGAAGSCQGVGRYRHRGFSGGCGERRDSCSSGLLGAWRVPPLAVHSSPAFEGPFWLSRPRTALSTKGGRSPARRDSAFLTSASPPYSFQCLQEALRALSAMGPAAMSDGAGSRGGRDGGEGEEEEAGADPLGETFAWSGSRGMPGARWAGGRAGGRCGCERV